MRKCAATVSLSGMLAAKLDAIGYDGCDALNRPRRMASQAGR
jgi:hypothetical protein